MSFPSIPIPVPERAELTDLQLRAIGLVILEWARMEESLFVAMSMAFGQIPGQPSQPILLGLTMMMAAGMSARTSLGLMRAIIHTGFPAEANRFNKLADQIAREGKRRDIIAHAALVKAHGD